MFRMRFFRRKKIENEKEELAKLKEEHEDVLKKRQTAGFACCKSWCRCWCCWSTKVIDKFEQRIGWVARDLTTVNRKVFITQRYQVMRLILLAKNWSSERISGWCFKDGNKSRCQCWWMYLCASGKRREANYKKGKLSKRAWNTFQTRRATFKNICDALDYNYKKQKVSCNPSGYAGTGGAMGVAQFMPDTWNGYKSQVASKTGHNPPDPWTLLMVWWRWPLNSERRQGLRVAASQPWNRQPARISVLATRHTSMVSSIGLIIYKSCCSKLSFLSILRILCSPIKTSNILVFCSYLWSHCWIL